MSAVKISRIAMLGAVATALVGVGVAGPAQAAPGATASGPITASQSTVVKTVKEAGKKRKRIMDTTATLEGTTLYGTTTTRTEEKFRGFRGCVTVLYVNSSGTAIGSAPEQCFGVDGDAIGTPHRVDTWNADVPAGIAAETASLTIQHYQI